MGRLYDQDLRERVVDAARATSQRRAVARFEVRIATAVSHVRLHETLLR